MCFNHPWTKKDIEESFQNSTVFFIAKIAEEKNFKEYQRKVKEGAKLNYDIAREQKALEVNAE